LDVIETAGITVLTVMVMPVLLAVAVVAQGALEVMMTVTISLLTSVVVVNVTLVAPGTLVPLTSH